MGNAMVANVRGYTPNYGFKLINFDTPRWHTLEYANWTQLDSMFLQFGASGIRGEWLNATEYLVGERVFDVTNGLIYRCLVQHTSAATGTFADDRLAHPTYWSMQLGGVPVYRGDWSANTSYAQGDIVAVNDYEYFLCTAPHISIDPFPGNGAQWQTIFDATEVVTDAQTAANDAMSSAQQASGLANSAAQSEADAEAAAEAAADSAYLASVSQGAFRWNFDADAAMGDPGTANVKFNNTNWSLVTAIAISVQTADVGNPDVSNWIVSWDDSTTVNPRGTLYMREASHPENFAIFNVVGNLTDNDAWIHVPVTYVNHLGSFSTNDTVSVSFSRTGNTGASGSGTGDMQSIRNLDDVENPATSRTNLGLGPSDTPAFTQITVANPPTQDNHVVTRAYLDASPAIFVSDTPPPSPADNTLWWESDSGILYLRYNDGNSSQWVQAVAIPALDTSLFVQKTGGSMTGPLILHDNPTNILGAAPKQYVDAPFDEGMYARSGELWLQIPTYQQFSLGGLASIDITVPLNANAVRITGAISPTTATAVAFVLQVSVSAGVFLIANGDYTTNGFQQASDSATIANLHNQQTVPGLRLTANHVNANQPVLFEGFLKVRRYSTSGRISGDFRSVITSATNYVHCFYQVFVVPASMGSELKLLALRLKPATGSDVWAADSFINVEWM